MTSEMISRDNYTSYALRTNQWDYPNLWDRMGLTGQPNPVWVDMYHGALGVFTEAGELCDALKKATFYGRADKVNLVEEIGDCFWYLAILGNAAGFTMADLVNRAAELPYENTPKNTLLANLGYHAGQLLLDANRGVYTIAGLEWSDIEHSVRHTMALLVALLALVDVTVEECLALNIAKLMKRYPTKFNEEQAVSRDTDAERTLLEKGLL